MPLPRPPKKSAEAKAAAKTRAKLRAKLDAKAAAAKQAATPKPGELKQAPSLAKNKKSLRYEGVERRVQLIALGMTLALSLLCLQFWRLQVLDLDKYTAMSEDNRVWPKRLKSDRGIIYGRNGEIIADNRASVDIVFVPGDCPPEEREATCRRLETLLTVPAEALIAKMKTEKGEPFSQIDVKRDVSSADRIRIEEHAYELPGVFSTVRPQRRYPYGETAGQLVGYLGEINEKELEAAPDKYVLGDLVGRDGLEKQYESLLHGEDGYMVVTKYASGRPQLRTDMRGRPFVARRDSRGHLLTEEPGRRQDPVPGKALHLTLDMDFQWQCEQLLHDEVGAIAVLDADTGGVLALASSPGYDPSVFVSRGNNAMRQELLTEGKPRRMRNRCYLEQYPPGSVFKCMLASAALEEGAITPATTFFCPGSFRLSGGSRAWHCWRRSGHGTVTVNEALAFSCDVFFYNVGLRLAQKDPSMGPDKIAEWAHRMGMGTKTGIDLPGEIQGLIPDREWKKQINADKGPSEQRWYDGETVNVSIGQGSVATTPLQNAVMMACIVNGGYRVTPHLNADLGALKSERFLSDATIATVVKGMRMCVEKGQPPSGTGHAADIPGMFIIGKTGSAQIMSLEKHEKYKTEKDIPKAFRDHAWFVAGVLDRDPRIALCILIEHGHHGSSVAAPIAKQVIQYFYSRKNDMDDFAATPSVSLPESPENGEVEEEDKNYDDLDAEDNLTNLLEPIEVPGAPPAEAPAPSEWTDPEASR